MVYERAIDQRSIDSSIKGIQDREDSLQHHLGHLGCMNRFLGGRMFAPGSLLFLETTVEGRGVYLHAQGASEEGDRPFVAVMSTTNGESNEDLAV
jgi:hypothetical protein